MNYNSQFGQDEFLDNIIFKNAENLSFAEIGAADPIEINNTYFFEKHRGWNGVLIEARPSACDRLRSERSSEVVNACISRKKGRSIFLDYGVLAGLCKYMGEREHEYIEQYNSKQNEVRASWVDTIPLWDILRDRNITHLHFLGVDVEGAEIPILETIDFASVFIDVIMAEANSPEAGGKLDEFLNREGYSLKKVVGVDRIYVHSNSVYQ
jgi:hypothetical protein